MGGGAVRPGPTVVFWPLLKKISGKPYLKIFYFSQLFIADAPVKNNPKIDPWLMDRENCTWPKGFTVKKDKLFIR